MSIIKTIVATATLAAVLIAAAPSVAYDSEDECIHEETFKCLDQDDFWVCYDFILEQCKNHGLAPADMGFTAAAQFGFSKSKSAPSHSSVR